MPGPTDSFPTLLARALECHPEVQEAHVFGPSSEASKVCIHCCLDVATHLAAAAGLDVPDCASAIDRLGELGVLPEVHLTKA